MVGLGGKIKTPQFKKKNSEKIEEQTSSGFSGMKGNAHQART